MFSICINLNILIQTNFWEWLQQKIKEVNSSYSLISTSHPNVLLPLGSEFMEWYSPILPLTCGKRYQNVVTQDWAKGLNSVGLYRLGSALNGRSALNGIIPSGIGKLKKVQLKFINKIAGQIPPSHCNITMINELICISPNLGLVTLFYLFSFYWNILYTL